MSALGKVGDPRSARHLTATLNDISPRVRAAAGAIADRAVGNPRFQEQAGGWLEPLRGDPHPSVRMATEAALARLFGR